MRVWDCHTDVLSRLLHEPLEGFLSGRGAGPERHYDLERIGRGGVSVMVCALFSRDDTAAEHPVVRTLRMIERAYELEARSGGRVEVASSGAAIDRIVAEGRTALVLSIENAIACLDKLELLSVYHRLGVRALGLAWNGRNYAVDGCVSGDERSRLSRFGHELLAEMARLRMVVDVSHLSEGCFWEVLERYEGPVIASHSNLRALAEHPRNLTDRQAAAIAERGGVIGVNFYPRFLRADLEPAEVTRDDLVAHVLGLCERVGDGAVGVGSDFDGIDRGPRGAEDPACFPALWERLRREGLPEEALARIAYGNLRRVFGAVMDGAAAETPA